LKKAPFLLSPLFPWWTLPKKNFSKAFFKQREFRPNIKEKVPLKVNAGKISRGLSPKGFNSFRENFPGNQEMGKKVKGKFFHNPFGQNRL